MKFYGLFLSALLASSCAFAAAPKCDEQRAIWASEKNGSRFVVYGSDGVQGWHTDIYLEEWRGDRIAWRARGKGECGNGASICSLIIPSNSAAPEGEAGTTDAVIETIDDNNDGLSEFVVFASLAQPLYYAGGLKDIEWFNGFLPAEDERVTPPNVYKFLGCRKTAAVELMEAPRSGMPQAYTPVGTVFGGLRTCRNYNETKKVENHDTYDGFWFMDDTRLRSLRETCLILSRTDRQLNLLCEAEDAPDEPYKVTQDYELATREIVLKMPADQSDHRLWQCDKITDQD